MQREPRTRTVLLAADIRLLLEALQYAIQRGGHYAVIGATTTSAELLQFAAELKPDIVLAEACIARAAGVARAIIRTSPSTKTVAFAVQNDQADILKCIEAGVSGYVLRDAGIEELLRSLDAAIRGEAVCSPDIAACAFARIATLAAHRQQSAPRPRLPDRQTQILSLIEEGLTNKEIANRLCIELSTVKNHVHALLTNMGVHRRSQAVAKYRLTQSSAPQTMSHAANHET